MYCVYILKSLKNGKYYIGYTDNIERRLKQHNSGRTRSIKNNEPFMLIYKEQFTSRADAYRRERQIKRYKGGEAFKKLVNSGGLAER